jgi:peptidoglycan hydrolase-like protein with peptidoglycan-binding domain
VPPWPPFAGPPPGGFFQPAWAEQPDLRPLAAPAIVSADVKLAQAMLNAAIAPVPRLAIDGLFGPLVDVAMRALRAAVGLAPGVGIDPEGWLALAIAAPFPVLEPGVGNPPMSGPPVLLVQRLLNTISGTDFLPEDGVYTTDTADRVSALQSASGLAQTGIVDQATWLELARLFDHFNGTGAERVELGFDRARSSGGGPALVLLDRRRIDDAVMPFTDRLDESWATRTGLWVELQDSLERPVFRLALGTLLSRAREVPAGPGGKIARPGVPDQTATLAFVVPVMGAARRLVVFGTLDTGDDGFASPILTIDPW